MGLILSRIKRILNFPKKDNISNLEWKLDFFLKCLKEYEKIKMKELEDFGKLLFVYLKIIY